MEVRYHPAAVEEQGALPPREKAAMANAVAKLRAVGAGLDFPHQSAVRGTDLRELRPRAGDSPWRGLYRRYREDFVIGAIAPEATLDPRGFQRAVTQCQARLADLEEGEV